MSEPFHYSSAFCFPTAWSQVVQPLLAEAGPDEAAVDALLASQSSVPTFVRQARDPFSLYDGGATSDVRLKLMSVIRVYSAPGVVSTDKKVLKKILADRHSSHVEGFALDEKGAATVLAAGLSDSPLARVRFLDATDNGLPTATELSALLAHPKLAELDRLVLSGAALKERFMMVARMPAVSSVQTLLLGGCDKIPKKDYDAFAAASWSRLKSLRIGSSTWEIKEGDRDAIWRAPWARNLEQLAIHAFRGAEARLLADSGVLPNLKTLLLNGAKFTEDEVRPLLSQLRSCIGLSVSCQLGVESAKALIAAECVPKLEVCELNLTADARALLLAAGLDDKAVKQRCSAERRYSFRL